MNPDPKIKSLATLLLVLPLGLTAFAADRSEDTDKFPAVAVSKVTREDLTQTLTCQAELRPWQEVDLHAKVAGYLENISVDIGDTVTTGQLLATLEVPELQDDLKRATAALARSRQEVARAEAAAHEARVMHERLLAVDKAQPHLVAQQELDSAAEKHDASASAVAAAQAEVEVSLAEIAKLRTVSNYCRITAPFSGVITKRYADPGALIQAGTASSTQTLPLVRLSQNDRLRLDIPVSVSFVSRIQVGDPVEVRLNGFETVLTAKIARTTCKVDSATRTMEIEADIPNPDLKLIPGMYASATLRLDHRDRALTVPVEAVSRQKSTTVLVVNSSHKVEERPVKLGLETPQKFEVISGLKENELVLVGSRAHIQPGQEVRPEAVSNQSITQ